MAVWEEGSNTHTHTHTYTYTHTHTHTHTQSNTIKHVYSHKHTCSVYMQLIAECTSPLQDAALLSACKYGILPLAQTLVAAGAAYGRDKVKAHLLQIVWHYNVRLPALFPAEQEQLSPSGSTEWICGCCAMAAEYWDVCYQDK